MSLAAVPTAFGQTTWYVDDDAPADPGPGDPTISDPLEDGSAAHPFDAIQEGIDAAQNGDIVMVADGVYTGDGNKNLDFAGKAITVRSETGPDNCIIDCEGDGRGAYFHSGENNDAVLESLTIRNGYVDPSSSGGDLGGGILCHNSSPTVSNCVVRENHAEGPAGSGGLGGGIACLECSPTIVRCWILDNTCVSWGGGICFWADSSTISECTISNNAADVGGGICCNDESTTAIIQCTITRNTAYFQPYVGGGGIYCMNGSSPTISGCKITANTAHHGGGGICTHYSSPLASNCTIAGNASNFGGGVYCTHGSSVMLTNCIIWANSAPNGPQIAVMSRPSQPSILTVSYTDVQGGEADAYIDPNCTLNWGPGNIDADPLFVDPENDYHLSAGSPCIDAGDNTAVPDWLLTDLDGNPRFVDDAGMPDCGNGTPPIVDMGAYEFQGATCFGDLDGDNDVDLADLAELLGQYGEPGPWTYGDGDLNCDGDVDFTDLSALLAVYGTACE